MPLRAYLSSIGDSLVIGEDDETFKVHVHTDIPGAALTEAQKYGTLELAKIENMRTQADDAGRRPDTPRAPTIWTPWRRSWRREKRGHKVAAAGEGRTAFWPCAPATAWPPCSGIWAADAVVSGGQTMNPSTEEHPAGIDQAPRRDRVRPAQQQATSSWPPSSARA